MVALRKRANPVEGAYALCDQAVTVYRRDAPDSITRTVYEHAHLSFDKGRNTEKTGSKDATSFLLVIPGNADIQPDDKAVGGVGPEIATDAEWRSFIPSKVENLVVVRHVDRHPWDGSFPHVEARG